MSLKPRNELNCDPKDFGERLKSVWPELSEEQWASCSVFTSSFLAENEIQNLTRLISPQDFIEGHVLDVKELLRSGLFHFQRWIWDRAVVSRVFLRLRLSQTYGFWWILRVERPIF